MHARITQAERAQPIYNWPEVAPARVEENAGAVTVYVETPGLEAADLDVSIRRGHLVIQSHDATSSDDCGAWSRIDLALVREVTARGATARLSNGLLFVRIPRTRSDRCAGGPIPVHET